MSEILYQESKSETEERLERLLQAARNARETTDYQTALKHYEEISTLCPNNWEALFYLVLLKTTSITNGEIASAAANVCNCLPKTLQLIKETEQNEQARMNAVKEVFEQCHETATRLTSYSAGYYDSVTRGNGAMAMTGIYGAASSLDAKRKARYESAQRSVNIANIMCCCGNAIESTFGMQEEFYQQQAIFCWEKMLELHFDHIKLRNTAVFNQESVDGICAKIQKYKPTYTLPDVKATGNRNYTILGVLIALIALGLSAWWCINYLDVYF